MKTVYFVCIYAAMCAVVLGLGDMGKGRWSTVSVDKCEEDDEGPPECSVDVVRRKYNRSLDVFDIDLDCGHDIDDTVAAIITICKHVDGGCKEWQVVADDSLPRFGKKYAESNMRRAFELAQLDPPDFPIKAGKYGIKDFAVDYCEFPKDCMYGRFTAVAKLLKDGKVMTCVQATVDFDDDTEGYECGE